MDLVPDSKFNNQKIKENLGQYFIGMLLMPWIWVFGLLVLEFVLLSYYNFQPKNAIREFNLLQIFKTQVDLNQIFWIVVGFTIVNYSLSFFNRKSYPRLSLLLFYLSLFSLSIVFTFIWPYFLTVLGQE